MNQEIFVFGEKFHIILTPISFNNLKVGDIFIYILEAKYQNYSELREKISSRKYKVYKSEQSKYEHLVRQKHIEKLYNVIKI